jgi:hypothetical protein
MVSRASLECMRARKSFLVLVGSVVALALASSAGAAKIPGESLFDLSRVQVQTQSDALLFAVKVVHAPAHDSPDLEWSLAPAGGAACENSGYGVGLRSLNGLVVWDQQGPTFRWTFRPGACTGTVSIVAENSYEHCTAKVVVAVGRVTSASPACALGGYSVGFSTLPVPAGVFDAYHTVAAQLRKPPKTAAAAVRTIRNALQAQSRAFALFPPVWFCDFSSLLTPIVAVRIDILHGTRVPPDIQAAKEALAKCAPSSIRAAFARAAGSTSPAALDAAFAHVPPVFGFNFSDVVDRVAAESIALDRAEQAARAGNLTLAARDLATASSSAGSFTTALDHYQHHVVNVENANG